ncbi:universal stress protein [Motilimonas sp. 1_MG-2023]|uniref:universal stress protein n=1 Tax=Motilimonas sp. 1_MG-2023 TaxID=3062672 RepID=UPI0026E3AA14|nr:universal stress protein [Motilimonas sp. 1_MG-2023]MDO6526291.1 universal stress protein [Motilimonas sp. 1_MG-2023]
MYKNILVPVDLNATGFSDKALKTAIWQAKQSQAKLFLLTILPGMNMPMVASYFPESAIKAMANDTRAQLKAFAEEKIPDQLDVVVHVGQGKPYRQILTYAHEQQIDLIIMPSHKRSKLNKAVLGSVAAKVVERAPIDVMVIKP